MQVDTFYRPNWQHQLRHHIWLTGSMKQITAGQKWAEKYAREHGITLVQAGPEVVHRARILDKVKRPDSWRVILMSDKVIDALLLKLTVI